MKSHDDCLCRLAELVWLINKYQSTLQKLTAARTSHDQLRFRAMAASLRAQWQDATREDSLHEVVFYSVENN